MSLKEQLGRRVLLIRGSLFLLQLLTTYLIPPYDTSATEAYPNSLLSSIGHGNWDAIYFNYLSRESYNYEKFGAFFPLYPAVVAMVAFFLYLPLQIFMSYDSCIILGSILMNNSLFYINSLLLYKLSRSIGLSDVQSYKAGLLYAVNPASIFMSVGYTESIFSLFVILGLLIRELDSQWYFLCFAIATGIRSNGLSLILFIVYDHVLCMIKSKSILIVNLICMGLQVLVAVAPFVYFQNHLHHLYCHDRGNGSSWCDNDFKLSYGYIQSTYWGVGLFKYWEPKQLPNFLLAAPMILVVVCILISWVIQTDRQMKLISSNYTYISLDYLSNILNFELCGYIHLGLLTLLGLVSMHVQVLTRFLVGNCPMLFLYCVKLDDRVLRVVLCYFVVYCTVGTALHSTFYPWT